MVEVDKGKKFLLFWTVIAYCLIGIEIIIMISPFALYFYSVYGPVLQFLAASPLTSWSTEFFLPHLVFPDDPLVRAISLLQVLMVVGLLLFALAAIPLYYGRFTGKGVVKRSFYGKVRHPQYLFLAISGFGLMLYWPRFIILIMFITMLFVYYALARNEEWRMQQEQPEAYAHYMAKTPMFLPGEPGGRLFRLLFGRIQPKWLGIVAAYCLTVTLAVLLAFALRSYTVRTLPMVKAADARLLFPCFPAQTKRFLPYTRRPLARPKCARHCKAGRPTPSICCLGIFFSMPCLPRRIGGFPTTCWSGFPRFSNGTSIGSAAGWASFSGFFIIMSGPGVRWKPIMRLSALFSCGWMMPTASPCPRRISSRSA